MQPTPKRHPATLFRVILIALGALLFASELRAANVKMAGAVSYSIEGNTVYLSVEKIQNLSNTNSGSLALELWASVFTYDGIAASGYSLAQAQLGSIPAGGQLDYVTPAVNWQQPASGNYNIVLALLEQVGNSYAVRHWYNFSDRQSFGENPPAVPKITSSTNATASVGAPFQYQIVASNNPLEYRVSSLPIGLVYSRTTGTISGTATNSGNYTIQISAGNNGGTTTNTLNLLVAKKPSFTLQPVGTNVYSGTLVRFASAATGFPDVKYQWQKNGSNIPGATRATYAIASATPADAGNYRVIAYNAGGQTLSAFAPLTVCNYTLSPTSASYSDEGGTGTVNVSVSGGCSWDAVNTNDWISITLGGSGDGDGAFTYSVAANTGETGRVGFFTVGNKQFAVTQSAPPAPVSIAGLTLSFASTNDSAGWFLPGNFQIIISPSDDTCKVVVETNSVAGTYEFVRTGAKSGTLTLTVESQARIFDLAFSKRRLAQFSSSSFENVQSGTVAALPTVADFNGDTLADLVWQNSSGTSAAWLMNGTDFLKAALFRNAGSNKIVAAGDFNRDGQTDLVLQTETRKIALWLMNGTNFVSGVYLRNGTPAGAGWNVAGAADFNQDGYIDLLFQNDDGRTAVWYLAGTTFIQAVQLRDGVSAGAGWRVVGTADLNDDGYPDVLWQHTDGRVAVWNLVNGNFVNGTTLKTVGAGWKLIALTDLNRDSRMDFVWQNGVGKVAVWFMDGSTFLSSAFVRNGVAVAPSWRAAGPK
jgi:hypothetical protein